MRPTCSRPPRSAPVDASCAVSAPAPGRRDGAGVPALPRCSSRSSGAGSPRTTTRNRTSANILADPFTSEHWLGTDELGRDILSRLIVGTRVAVQAATLAVSIAIGARASRSASSPGTSPARSTWRSCDSPRPCSRSPASMLAIAYVGIRGPGLTNAMIAVGIIFAPNFVRIVRASVLEVREETFVEASRSIGTPAIRILRSRILPERAAAAARADLAGRGFRAPRRGGAQLPRPRRAATDGELGPDARAGLPASASPAVADRVPGRRSSR